MGMVHKGGNAVPFHGDHHPVSIYVGDKPIFEPIYQAQNGKTLTFENAYNDVAEVTVFGESTQETFSGKNLLPAENVVSGYYDVPGFPDKINASASVVFKTAKLGFLKPGTYTLSFAKKVNIIRSMSDNHKDSNNSFFKHLSITSSSGTLYGLTAVTFNLEEEDSNVSISFRDSTSSSTVWDGDVMLELGSTATEYEPYCGGIPSPNPDYPQPIESIKSVELVSSNADGSKSATRTIDLQGHELRSLPDGTRDEVVVHRDGTVELVLRCDASMFDPSYPVSSEWKLAAPQTIQLPSIDPLPTYHPYTVVDGNDADISAHVKVFE